jgi:hypothetical protein
MNGTEIETIENAEMGEYASLGLIQTNKRDIWAESRYFMEIVDHIREAYEEGDIIPIMYNEETHVIIFLDKSKEISTEKTDGPLDMWLAPNAVNLKSDRQLAVI